MEESYWDDVYREKVYYPDYKSPVDNETRYKGKPKGEFDVLAVNYEDKIAMYTEVKGRYNENAINKANKQIRRAKKFFEDTEWEIIGRTYVVTDEQRKLAAD